MRRGAGCLAYLDVTGSTTLFGSAMDIAEAISERVKFELGITVSIGVSDNKITAKLGSDYKKPDAITRIMPDNYREIVYPLPVEDLLYVGPATSRKLRYVGVSTIGRLAECDEDFLKRRLMIENETSKAHFSALEVQECVEKMLPKLIVCVQN